MQELLWIGAGGFTGAVLRSLAARFVAGWSEQVGFPFGTLLVNAVGCLIIGLLSSLVETRGLFNEQTRAFMLVGMLGAFTTFSTFSHETLALFRTGHLWLAMFNVGVHIILGLFSVQAGRMLVVWAA